MKARVSVDALDMQALPVTVAITLQLGDWRKLQKELHDGEWPKWQVSALIRTALSSVDCSVNQVVEGREVQS